MDTMRVIDVYGEQHVISRSGYDSGRTQIALYTKNGKRKLSEYYEAMGWSARGRCTTIHRQNIAQVVQP